MRATQIAPALALLGGCSDRTFYVDVHEPIIFNPLELETPENTDSYEQVEQPEVDILFVVDNSGSMSEEQSALANNFPVFLSYFQESNLDWHIGVVSTDMQDPDQSGKLIDVRGMRWIDPSTPDPEDVFATMALLGTNGSSSEQGILATYASFELQDDFNHGFIRDTSSIHVIVVSDEPDSSPAAPVTLDEFIGYMNGLRADPDAVTFNSIVGPTEPEWPCEDVSAPGIRYIQATAGIGGVFWSLCDKDWNGALEAMGLAASGYLREYTLSERPVDGTIHVTVENEGYTIAYFEWDEATATGDWIYSESRNSITFVSYVPPPTAVVNITYDVLSSVEEQ